MLAVSGIGENIMLLPSLQLLKKHLPGASITLAVRSDAAAGLLAGNCPADNMIVCDYSVQNTLPKILSLLKKIRNQKFDITINAFPSSRTDKALLCLLSGSKSKISHRPGRGLTGILGIFYDFAIPVDKGLHDIEQNIRLLEPLGINGDGLNIPQIAAAAQKNIGGIFTVGIHPGSSREFNMSLKRWPAERFASLAKKFVDDKKARVLVFIGPDDEDAAFEVEDKYANDISFVRRPIADIPAEINRCGLFVGNDSALVHISAALGVPTVAIFGPTDPVRTKPKGNNVSVIRSADLNSLSVSEIFEAACPGLRSNNTL